MPYLNSHNLWFNSRQNICWSLFSNKCCNSMLKSIDRHGVAGLYRLQMFIFFCSYYFSFENCAQTFTSHPMQWDAKKAEKA